MSKVNIFLKDEVHKAAKIISVVKGKKLSDYLAEAIEKIVDKDKKEVKKDLK